MTGTSIDSLDAALVRIHDRGLTMRAELVRAITRPLGDLTPRLRALAEQQPMTAGQIAALSRDFSLLHLAALRDLIAEDRADLVSVHGQTVFHAPPVSWQMLTPAVIAHGLGTPVVSDLRAADLAVDGQGAPITPLADWVFFRGLTLGGTSVVNLGGFCNVTYIPPPPLWPPTPAPKRGHGPLAGPHQPERSLRDLDADEVTESLKSLSGRDVCACNHLLDGIARQLMDVPFDRDGERAAAGSMHDIANAELCGILRPQSKSRRSLGTGDETGAWIARWRTSVTPEDLACTACWAIATTILESLDGRDLLLLAGGGVKNRTLAGAIKTLSGCEVALTDDYGIPAEYREAAAMAVLGALSDDSVPITLPQVTGVCRTAPISGTWVRP